MVEVVSSQVVLSDTVYCTPYSMIAFRGTHCVSAVVLVAVVVVAVVLVVGVVVPPSSVGLQWPAMSLQQRQGRAEQG